MGLVAARGQRRLSEQLHGSGAPVSLSFAIAKKEATEGRAMYDGRTRARNYYRGSRQPPPGRAVPKGSALQQQERRGDPESFSSEDSPGCLPCSESAHEAVGPPTDHKTGVGLGDPDRQRDGSSVTGGRNTDPGFAPKGTDSRDPERLQTKDKRKLKSGPAPRGARDPVAEAGHKAQQQSMFPSFSSFSNWFGTKDAGSSSSGSRTSNQGSSPGQLEQSQEEAKTLWRPFPANEDAVASDTDKMKTNPLQALRNSPHPQSTEFLRALEWPLQIVVDLLAENQRLQELNSNQTLQAEDTQQQLLRQDALIRKMAAEIQRLKLERQELQAENQELREELGKGLVPESEAASGEMPVPQSTAFPVQVRVTGHTGGCEKQFLGDVAKLLVGHKVSLQVEEYQEDSPCLLLLFPVISSREGTDIDNALSGLKGERKVLLVVLHHKPKNSTRFFAESKPQVQHPALVATVHAYFSVQDGFHYWKVNEDAVASVAETIVQLTRENRGESAQTFHALP